MYSQLWNVDEAQRLTHDLVPRLFDLASKTGILSTFKNVDWNQGVGDWNERYALSLSKLIVFADAQPYSSDEATWEQISESPLYEQVKAFYDSEYVAASPSSPISIFGNLEHQGANSLELPRVYLESKLLLSSGEMGGVSRAWRTVSDMKSHASLQSTYWLFESLRLDVSMGTRIAVALMGMRLLNPDGWLLPGCDLEEAFWQHRKELMSLSTLNKGGRAKELYIKVGNLVFDVLDSALSNRVGALEQQVETSAGGSELIATQKRLSKNEKQALEAFRAIPELTLSELAKLLGVSDRSAQRIAKSLCSSERLLRVGSKKSGVWEVVDDD